MARPKLKTDEEVLQAANVVLKRVGPIDFTLSDVAHEVGLSRAALIQRFSNKETLVLRMMERGVVQLRADLKRLPSEASPQGLWEFLQALARGMGKGYDFSVNALLGWYEQQSPELRRLAALRIRYVQDAIRARLPPDAPDSAAPLLHSVFMGASIQWLAAQRPSLATFVLRQVAETLRLLFPEEKFELR